MFLVFFECEDSINDQLYNLKGDTGQHKYEAMMQVFRIISLENFAQKNIS